MKLIVGEEAGGAQGVQAGCGEVEGQERGGLWLLGFYDDIFCSSVQLMTRGINVSFWMMSCNGSFVGGMFNHLPRWHL